MKKLVKNNIKLIIGLILGLVISGITVTATTILYNSDQVSFTAEDSDFDATNVNEALNKLYDYHKYIDTMKGSQAAYGTFTAATTLSTITTGFQPSKVILYINNGTRIFVFDNAISSSTIFKCGNVSTCSNDPIANWGFSITSNGFTYKSPNTNGAGFTYYYAIK